MGHNPFLDERTVVSEQSGRFFRVPIGLPLGKGFRELAATDDYHGMHGPSPKASDALPPSRSTRVVVCVGGAKRIPANAKLPYGYREVVTTESLERAAEAGRDAARTEVEWVLDSHTIEGGRKFAFRDFVEKHRWSLSVKALTRAIEVGWEGDDSHYVARKLLPAVKASWGKRKPPKRVHLV